MVKLTSFDFFRKLPREYTYGTASGGILSILVLVIVPMLIFLETLTFLSGEIQTDIVIDPNSEENLRINFNVTMLELPCQFTEVDVYNFFGAKRLDIEKDIQKAVVTGQMGEKFLHYHYEIPRPPVENQSKAAKTSVPPGFEVKSLSQENFTKILAEDKFSFVNFHAGWCHWCRELQPVWKSFAVAAEEKNLNVNIYNVHCPDNPQLCDSEQKIAGYPTLRMFHQGTALHPDFQYLRAEDVLLKYVEKVIVDSHDGPPTRSEKPRAVAAIREHVEEGCNVAGTLYVKRVPGNFVVLANSRDHNFDPKGTNTTHVIHHLTFGDQLTPAQLKQIPKNARHDIDPFQKELFSSSAEHTSHEHYIKLVSTFYRLGKFGSSEVLGYRITASNHFYDSEPSVPDVKFSYDMSPTAAVVTRGGRRWYEFLTNLFAIIGGFYVVMELTDGLFYKAKQAIRTASGKKS
uniref:Thioredoxin domain-containing protein n=2 Tax=Rhodosorus marinus TaxID=101924 RepID=A0A7S0G3I9_9RHOD|mmetsp:Transcript_2873/g.4125  ORF Transcript_2873/g.4125 Transcript_2873/m.4125 type:complete len:459 (+) Transcript_2873:122-1498(+)